MVSRVAVSQADRTRFKNPGLVSETDVGGVLRAIGVSGGVRKHFFTIEIDGEPILTDSVPSGLNKYLTDSTVYGGQQTHNSMGVNLPFNDSLHIQIKDEPYPCSRPRFWAIYEKDLKLGNDELPEADEENSSREFTNGFVVEEQEYEINRGINTERILNGRAISAELVFAEQYDGIGKDVYEQEESIQLELRFRDWTGQPLESPSDSEHVPEELLENTEVEETIELLLKPPGRNYPVESYEIEWRDQTTTELYVDTPGDYELFSTFANFGNIPATFTVRSQW